MLKNWLKDENGQGMVEYGLIIGLISIVAIIVLVSLGGRVRDQFQSADDYLATAAP